MEAEVYIKARKVFVPDKVENTEKCPQCDEQGQTYFLRYFYLSFEEAIYKCGNSKCLYPFHHFVFKNLTDKTVYYYEEVENGTNDIMLKVSMNGQNKYKSANPMRTELFSESQHNPDIESYDFDFLDFMNDNASAPSTSLATATKPNDDFFAFLNEIPNASANTNDNNFDANGIDSFIDNLLNSTPSTSATIWPNQQNSPPKTEEFKLSKAMEHIEKVKGRKKVKEERPQETFLQRVCQTKATQSTNKRKQTATEKVSALVSSAHNLRPTQFVNQLKSLDLKNSNSSFLRTLAKVKEDTNSEAPSSNVEVKDEPTIPAQMKKRRRIQKDENELTAGKTAAKPRKKPVKRPIKVAATTTVVKAEPIDNRSTEILVIPDENKSIAKSLDSIPITIDLSRILLPKIEGKEMKTTIQMNNNQEKNIKRPRKKKAKQPEPKQIKIEQLSDVSIDSSTTTDTQNDVKIAPAEATVTVSQMETEIPPTEMSKKNTETKLPSSQNDSKSDEEDPLMAFSPVTESDLSRNHLMDLKTLNFAPNATTVEKTPTRRTYKRRSRISARKSSTKKINDDSDTESENPPSHQACKSNANQSAKPKKSTEVETIEPTEVETSPSPIMIKLLSDHSNELNSSQYVMTINVEDDTFQHSNETHTMSESNANLDHHMESFKSKLNENHRYHRKKFGKIVEKTMSVNELIDEWDSASERTTRSSFESEISIINPNDLPDESDCASIISIDSRTENTEIEE